MKRERYQIRVIDDLLPNLTDARVYLEVPVRVYLRVPLWMTAPRLYDVVIFNFDRQTNKQHPLNTTPLTN